MESRSLVAIVTLCWVVSLSSCGGGGGSSKSSASTVHIEPIPDGLNLVALDTDNGRQFSVAAFHVQSLYAQALYSLGYAPMENLAQQKSSRFNKKSRTNQLKLAPDRSQQAISDSSEICSSGGFQSQGDIQSGPVKLRFDQCVERASGIVLDGDITISVIEFNVTTKQPKRISYHAENFRQALASENLDITSDVYLELAMEGDAPSSTEFYAKITDNIVHATYWAQNIKGTFPNGNNTGEIAISQFGRANLKSLFEFSSELAGSSGSKLFIDTQETALVSNLDQDGDGLNEWRSQLSTLPANPEFEYASTSPAIVPPDAMAIDRNIEGELSIPSATDSDGDYVKLEILPLTALRIQQTNWQDFMVSSANAGNYALTVVATDQHGNKRSANFTLRIRLDTPVLEISSETAVMGGNLTIDLLPKNDDQGPFTYSIVSAPGNVIIDEAAKLHWDVDLPIYWPEVDVNFSIRVSNEDHATTHSFIVRVSDTSVNIPTVFTGVQYQTIPPYFEVDNNGSLSAYLPATDNISAVFTEEQGGFNRQNTAVTGNFSISKVLPAHHTGDGSLVVHIGGNAVVLTDRESGKKIGDALLPVFLDDSNYYAEVVDADNDGDDELLIVSNAYFGSSEMLLLSLPDLALLQQVSTANPAGVQTAQLDADENIELITGSGDIFDLATGTKEWQYTVTVHSETFFPRKINHPIVPPFIFRSYDHVYQISAPHARAVAANH